MITALRVGMRVRLPSGNVVLLLRRERGEWVCEYTVLPQARGEVAFAAPWLRRVGRQV